MTSRRFTQDDISQEQAETFNEVITRVAVLSDEWKALQVWTRLDWVIRSPEGATLFNHFITNNNE